MLENTGETRFRLPAVKVKPRKANPRFRKKLKKPLLPHPYQVSVSRPGQDQGPEDAAAAEVGPTSKGPRSLRFNSTVTKESILQHHSQSLAPPPDQDQGPEDAAATEVGSKGKVPRFSRLMVTPLMKSSRLDSHDAEAGPDSCSGALGASSKPEKLQPGAMAEPRPMLREVLAATQEGGNTTVSSRSHRVLFWRLRDKQNRVGLFEIGPGHELHRLTRMMQEGLWAATQVFMDNPPMGPPTMKDFLEVMTQVHEQGFELGTLAGKVFSRLRRSLGLTEEDYQATLGPGGPYLQFLSTSKSKASFFLSHDQRFFLKTQRRQEVQVLLSRLPRYVQHLRRYPHSLLARLLGVYFLRVAQGKKMYFIIMQSIFYPSGRITERYDIKGCELSRWVEPAPEGSPLLLVLKDLNFQGKTINIGSQRNWLLRQIELDTSFLRELNLLDYSLLVAFQLLHEDEKDCYSCLIFRTIKSVHGASNSEMQEGQNRRLLPNVPNALHILDGPNQRYFLGLVDLTTVYGLRKRMEQLWKMVRYRGQSYSTVSPAHYARRLCQWLEKHTE